MPFVCFIEIDKERGVVVSLLDEAGKLTQSIEMDGGRITIRMESPDATSQVSQTDASIVSTVEKGAQKSTMRQAADSIALECKSFTLDAETVQVRSEKDTAVEAGGGISVRAKGDLDLSTQSAARCQASRSVEIAAEEKLDLKGGAKATLAAQTTEITGSAKSVVQSQALLQMKAAKVDLKGDAQLDASAPVTNVGHSLTTVRGTLVKVEGALVKLG